MKYAKCCLIVFSVCAFTLARWGGVLANPSAPLSSLVSEYRTLATDCGGDLNLLKEKTTEMEHMAPTLIQSDRTAARDVYITLAKVYFFYGEMEKDKAKKIAFYQQC